MTENDQSSCPVTPLLASLVENADEEAGRTISQHVQGCPSCRAELERLLQAQKPGVPEWLKDLAVGLGFWALIGLALGGRGITDSITRTLSESGHTDKPKDK